MRRVAALGLLALLAATSGCFGILGPGEPDPDALSADASYDWNTSTDAAIDINRNNYTAVYDLSNASAVDDGQFEAYTRDALGTEQPLELRALQYRFENGTLVRYEEGRQVLVYENGTTRNTTALSVSRTRKRTVVQVPEAGGKLAYTAPKTGKQVTTPTFVEGSYEVVLPKDTSVGIPLLARVRPGGYRTTQVNDRVHIRWDQIQSPSLVVRYYLERDIQIFGAMVALLVVVGVGGAVYYLRQIRELVARREEVGLDVDVDDDSRRPPPGMG